MLVYRRRPARSKPVPRPARSGAAQAAFQSADRVHDQARTFRDRPARAVQDEVVVMRVGLVLEEVVTHEPTAVAFGLLDPAGGLVPGQAPAARRPLDAVVEQPHE